jgi:hypothetical protein
MAEMDAVQTMTVSVDRTLHLDFAVPAGIPAGETVRVELTLFPQTKTVNDISNLDAILDELWELTRDSPLTSDKLLEMRRQDIELEERNYRRLFAKDGADN